MRSFLPVGPSPAMPAATMPGADPGRSAPGKGHNGRQGHEDAQGDARACAGQAPPSRTADTRPHRADRDLPRCGIRAAANRPAAKRRGPSCSVGPRRRETQGEHDESRRRDYRSGNARQAWPAVLTGDADDAARLARRSCVAREAGRGAALRRAHDRRRRAGKQPGTPQPVYKRRRPSLSAAAADDPAPRPRGGAGAPARTAPRTMQGRRQ